jgi:hypothetical protein
MKIKRLFYFLSSTSMLSAVCLSIFVVAPVMLCAQSSASHRAAGQASVVQKLTLSQVEQLVSSKVPDSTLNAQIQKRGLAFKPSAADLDALRAKGAGPLTIAAVEALLPNTALGARPNKISATTDPSGAFISLLEQNWNWQSHWRVFLGPTYFGTATSFGRGAMGTLRYSLAETSDYPVFRALASKGLITLRELSIADAPTSLAPGVNIKIDSGAIVTLTEAGVRSGKVNEKEHNVTFAFGTYGVEKIASNTRVRISEDDYRLVEGTYVLNIAPEFDDVWGERGWPRHRDFQFRALFKYDSAESKWEIAYASAGHGERAMDTGPRGGNFESEKVPQTVNQLRMTNSGATSLAPGSVTKPTDSGPSLAATMQFIQDKLNGLGRVTYAETLETPSGHTFSNTFTIEASNVVADRNQCRISYHWKKTMDVPTAQVVVDEDQGFSVRDFQNIVVKPFAQYLTEYNAIHGPHLAVPSTNPSLSALVLHPTDGKDRFFLFTDEALAGRVVKALTHAVELCGGGNKEPF